MSVNAYLIESDTIDLEITPGEKRKWIGLSGHNIPSFELFISPDWRGTNGVYYADQPSYRSGNYVKGVRLEFQKGKVVKTRASKGEKFLKSMLDMDKGSRYIGEFAFGTNYGVKKYTKNTLFDEKIGGTIHIAVGSGYPETGSKNKSSLHWDMMCDLRKFGEVYADNDLIYKNGKFLTI